MNIDLPTSISDWDTLKRYKTKNMVSICSSANGNWFFNSLSIALYGDESNFKILKQSNRRDLVRYKNFYLCLKRPKYCNKICVPATQWPPGHNISNAEHCHNSHNSNQLS